MECEKATKHVRLVSIGEKKEKDQNLQRHFYIDFYRFFLTEVLSDDDKDLCSKWDLIRQEMKSDFLNFNKSSNLIRMDNLIAKNVRFMFHNHYPSFNS